MQIFYRLLRPMIKCKNKPLTLRFLCSSVSNLADLKSQTSNIGRLQNVGPKIRFSAPLSAEEREQFLRDMSIVEDFLSVEEEQSIFNEIEPYLKRMRYEFDHWDNAIHGFRETERMHWTANNTLILDRVRQLAFPPGKPQLKHVHILDLSENGHIKPHIDSVKFCGDTIAGLSMLSDCIMRLVREDCKEKMADVLLKQRSLYIMKDSARYDFTHEVLGKELSVFDGEQVMRRRRISVICRSDVSSTSAR